MNPTGEQISEMLPHIRYEIESLLQTPNYDVKNQALEESVFFRKMAHGRSLHWFFTKSKRKNEKDDDVISKDFGFPTKPELDQKFLEPFNKDLFHLTYDRLKRTPRDKAWPMENLLPVIQWSKEFIDHVIENKTVKIDGAERNLWGQLKADIENKLPLQQNTSNVATLQINSLLKF